MTDFPVTLFHNPDCGTSRNVLAALEAQGHTPEVILYREAGWTEARLRGLINRLGGTARDVLRDRGTPADALGLLDPSVTDDALIAAMIVHPILVNRPIVETPLGVVLARPSERVFEVLERKPDAFTKEDGQVVLL